MVRGRAAAVAVAFAVGQFRTARQESQLLERRSKALLTTAWAEWAPRTGPSVSAERVRWRRPIRSGSTRGSGGAIADPRVLTVLNDSPSAIFDWDITVVPSPGWDTYVRVSAGRSGPLPPGGRLSYSLAEDDRRLERHTVQFSDRHEQYGPPRFVVLLFSDAWGRSWIRANGDLHELPHRSAFLPKLVHLRNPAMRWAGVLEEPVWRAFFDSVGRPAELSPNLSGLQLSGNLPWINNDRLREIRDQILDQKVRRRWGRYVYKFPERGVTIKVRRRTAVRQTRAFFHELCAATRSTAIVLPGDTAMRKRT